MSRLPHVLRHRVQEADLRIVLVVACCVTLVPAVASAQPSLSGYAAGGPATYSGFFGTGALAQASGGVEVLFAARAGVAAETGVLVNAGSVLGVSSVNAVVQSGGRGRRLTPFLTGGYTRMGNANSSFNGWNVGAGLTRWGSGRVGLRLEVRDQVRPDRRGTVHYWSFRVGIGFR
jgi:hypothetical protein